jgi:hypothetical protein
MATTTFVYSTTVSGQAGVYSWEAANNWNPAQPVSVSPYSEVVIGADGSNSTADTISSLQIKSLTNNATTYIGIGNTLSVTGQIGSTGLVGIVNNATISLLSGSSLLVVFSGDSGTYTMAGNNVGLRFGSTQTVADFTHATLMFDGIAGDVEQMSLQNAMVGTTSSSASVLNFGLSDSFTFNSAAFLSATQAVVSGGSLFLEDSVGTVLYTFGTFTEAAGVTGLKVADLGNGVTIEAVCFAQGTLIATADGERPVEDLAEGDMVATLEDGRMVPRAVKWIGHRRVNLAAHPHPERAAPVRIRAGAIADGAPARDLVVSPDHCLFIDGKLIPARLLVNDATIVQDRDLRAVTYYHVELDRHAVLLAEGLPAESYLDTGNRAFFSNAGLALVLHPEFQVNNGLRCWAEDACAPLAVSEAAVGPVWTRIADRADALGVARIAPPRRAGVRASEDGLRLLAGGRALRPVSVAGNRQVFVLPRGTARVTLASPVGYASDVLPYAEDQRGLGVAVSRIVVSRGADRIEVPVDHPMLTSGWHAPEQDAGERWRWTAGAAVLPIPPSDGGIVTVELELRGGAPRRDDLLAA